MRYFLIHGVVFSFCCIALGKRHFAFQEFNMYIDILCIGTVCKGLLFSGINLSEVQTIAGMKIHFEKNCAGIIWHTLNLALVKLVKLAIFLVKIQLLVSSKHF